MAKIQITKAYFKPFRRFLLLWHMDSQELHFANQQHKQERINSSKKNKKGNPNILIQLVFPIFVSSMDSTHVQLCVYIFRL